MASIYKWWIQIYATKGISAWNSYNKTHQEYVALMDPSIHLKN